MVAVALLWYWWRWRKTTKVLLSERDEIEDALVEAMEELETPLSPPDEGTNDQWQSHEAPSGTIGGAKYDRVKIDEAECADIVRRMKEYIEREQVYTNFFPLNTIQICRV